MVSFRRPSSLSSSSFHVHAPTGARARRSVNQSSVRAFAVIAKPANKPKGQRFSSFFGSQDGQSVNRSSIQAMSTSRVFGQDCPNNQTGEHPNVKQTNRRTILRFSMPMGTGAFYSFIFAQNDCKEWFVTIQYLMNLFDVVPQIRLALFRSYFLIQTTQGSQKKAHKTKPKK